MKKRARQSNEAIAQLPGRILAALKRTPMTIDQLGAALECYSKTVRKRLVTLEADGKAHSVQVKTSAGMNNVWHLGPNPQGTIVRPKRLRGEYASVEVRDMVVMQKVVRAWQPIDRRDPLVAYLFGEAK